MSLRSLLSQSVTLLHPTVKTDRAHNTLPDWTSPVEEDVAGLVEQTDTVEILVGRDTIVTNLMLFVPPEATVGPHDRARVDGVTYEVIGQPDVPARPRHASHHIEVRIRRLEG